MKSLLTSFVDKVSRLAGFERTPWLEYAPYAWETLHSDYDEDVTTEIQVKKFRRLLSDPPSHTWNGLADSAERTIMHLVALRAAWGRDCLKVIELGGGAGHYYCFFKEVLPPDVTVDYHITELPKMCAAGRRLNPDVTFHENIIPEGVFDLAICASSLQYIREWERPLLRLASSAFLYLGRTPITDGEAFTVRQNISGMEPLVFEVQSAHVLRSCVESLGYTRIHAFVSNPPLDLDNAPSEVYYANWLFKSRCNGSGSGTH